VRAPKPPAGCPAERPKPNRRARDCLAHEPPPGDGLADGAPPLPFASQHDREPTRYVSTERGVRRGGPLCNRERDHQAVRAPDETCTRAELLVRRHPDIDGEFELIVHC
jgi:hypothetical protein